MSATSSSSSSQRDSYYARVESQQQSPELSPQLSSTSPHIDVDPLMPGRGNGGSGRASSFNFLPPPQQQQPQQQQYSLRSEFDSMPHTSRSPSLYYAAGLAAAEAAAAERASAPAAAAVAQVRVHSGGVTVTPASSSSSSSSLESLFHGCCRPSSSRGWLLLLLYFLFVGYLVVGPAVLVGRFYLSVAQMVVVILFGLGIPATLYQWMWRTEQYRNREIRLRQQQQQPIDQSGERSSASAFASASPPPLVRIGSLGVTVGGVGGRPSVRGGSSGGFNAFFLVISRHYFYEMYQLFLTWLSCGSWLYYTYHLRYLQDATTGAWGYDSSSMRNLDVFVQVEYFLIVSLSVDYILRLIYARNKAEFVFTFYSAVDLGCFTGVAYLNFLGAKFAPRDATYDSYLFQGPFRFMRMRRALASLDKPIRRRAAATATAAGAGAGVGAAGAGAAAQRDVVLAPLYKLGPLVLSKRAAFIVLLLLRVVLFMCTAAALVLALEFPCASLVPSDLELNCTVQLQRFHLCVYFIIVTLSTVGYGDLSATTDLGRMLMCVIIVCAVIQVPREAQKFADLDAERKEQLDKIRAKEAATEAAATATAAILATVELQQGPLSASHAREVQQQQQQSSDGSGAVPTSLFPSYSPSYGPVGPSSSSGSSSSSGVALSAFLRDDRSLLLRWAEMQLQSTAHSRPDMLHRVAQAMDIEQSASITTQQQCALIARLLFGTTSADAASLPLPASPSVSPEQSIPRQRSMQELQQQPQQQGARPFRSLPPTSASSWHS